MAGGIVPRGHRHDFRRVPRAHVEAESRPARARYGAPRGVSVEARRNAARGRRGDRAWTGAARANLRTRASRGADDRRNTMTGTGPLVSDTLNRTGNTPHPIPLRLLPGATS